MLKSAGHVCYIKLFKPFNYLVLSTFSSFFYQGENHTSRGTDTERFRWTNPPGWKASPPLTAEHPRWCSGCRDASASSSSPASEDERNKKHPFKDTTYKTSIKCICSLCLCVLHVCIYVCIYACTCVMLAYCCSQSFRASCTCCSHRVWMALIWSSLWVSSWRSSSEHTKIRDDLSTALNPILLHSNADSYWSRHSPCVPPGPDGSDAATVWRSLPLVL